MMLACLKVQAELDQGCWVRKTYSDAIDWGKAQHDILKCSFSTLLLGNAIHATLHEA